VLDAKCLREPDISEIIRVMQLRESWSWRRSRICTCMLSWNSWWHWRPRHCICNCWPDGDIVRTTKTIIGWAVSFTAIVRWEVIHLLRPVVDVNTRPVFYIAWVIQLVAGIALFLLVMYRAQLGWHIPSIGIHAVATSIATWIFCAIKVAIHNGEHCRLARPASLAPLFDTLWWWRPDCNAV
jgi:hypothetical protein